MRLDPMRMLIPILFLLCIASSASSQTCVNAITATTPDSRFTVNGDEVSDHATGLIWQHCTLGQIGADCSSGGASTFTWQQALQAAEDERVATGLPWRLPNSKELESIVEESCYYPAINLTVFPNTTSGYYWSASPRAYGSNYVWYVFCGTGYSSYFVGGSTLRVRLVRAGQ